MATEELRLVEPPEWLAGCRGYRVDSNGGPVGVVADVRSDAASSRSAHLVVRIGMIGRRLVVIPADEVDAILPGARRLLLRPGWAPEAGTPER